MISREIETHMQDATTLFKSFPSQVEDNADSVNPISIFGSLQSQSENDIRKLDDLNAKCREKIQSLPVTAEKEKESSTSLPNNFLRINSSFLVDSVSADAEKDPATNRLRLFNTFWIFPTRNSNVSFYHSVLVACSQPNLKAQLIENRHFSHLLQKEITKELIQLFEKSTKSMFQGYADCAICSASNLTFNDYLQRKKAAKNTWETMPGDHFLCTPSLVAQTWRLNILIVWKKRGSTRVFALPHGSSDAPIIPILFAADKSHLEPDGNPTIITSSANRFFPLAVCEDKTDTWESTFTATEEIPESVQSTSAPIIVAQFVKKRDKEFALQSEVMVDGTAANGKDVSSDEQSELTADGPDSYTQRIMGAFIDDNEGNDDSGPPSFNPVLEQVDREMAMRQLVASNMSLFKLRRRRIYDNDSEDDVPLIKISPPPDVAQSSQTKPAEKPKAVQQQRPPSQRHPKGSSTLKSNGGNATSTPANATRGNSK
jgi:hypothetical protein